MSQLWNSSECPIEARWTTLKKPIKSLMQVAGLLVIVTALHYETSVTAHQLHSLHQRLFYIPIIWAAFSLGLRGSVATALVSSFLYGPHLLLNLGAIPYEALDSFYELLMFNIVGWITGVLVERANKARHQAEETKEKLAQSNIYLHERAVALERLQKYLDNILNSIDTGVIALNRRGQVAMFNRQAQELFALNIKQDHDDLLLHLNSHDRLRMSLDQLQTSRQSFDYELTWTDLEQNPKRLRFRGTILPSVGQDEHGFLLVVDDMTEVHSLAEQVRRSERMNALGQLVAGLAHEIRNPLGVINATAQILSDEVNSGSEMKEGLSIIRDEAQRLNRTLNIFLDFARPRAIHQQQVRLDTLLDDLALMFRKVLSQQSIVLHLQLDQAAAEVTVDPDLLKQVLINLILNAIQAMPMGGELGFEVRAAKNGTEFIITDTGTGITPENLTRIFDPFFTTKEAGTGIGLSVVQRLVDDMGGRISVTSEVNQGTTFHVYLPLTMK